ncbi:hypothetical protein [Duganella violaceipulchra]|uniref:Uncharacterized protein n=1 Tax=Duganella violaceipulchra TaxID=2849652 RepID=A0AA41HCF1_9BURK|nr:hypothetical protein [Duganella violaceicalia]MBV6322322.1 hypothetical protein [Duganella violaceicalia]MCP2011469.1 hypothetical protein [Duganella violaceicalia]
MSSEAAVASSTLSTGGTVTTVQVGARRSICYEFDTKASAADLALRYAVAVDGKVQSAYADQPGILDKSRKINLLVSSGSKVALFLNSDAHPDFRLHPVYTVVAGERDVLVRIVERPGRLGHERSVLPAPVLSIIGGKQIDLYSATLTGDIWMEISHLYTVAEVVDRLPADVSPTVRDAVTSIYAVLSKPELVVQFPASDSAPRSTLRLQFQESDNVRNNVTYCPLLAGVLPRTHPSTFAALITEAHAAAVTEVQVTSCWRPMLGSVVHRAGLGLDVTYIESATQQVHLNRSALTKPRVGHGENVSDEERRLYEDYEQKKRESAAKEETLSKAERKLHQNHDAAKTDDLQKDVAEARRLLAESKTSLRLAKGEWDKARGRDEPGLMADLRSKLSRNSSIRQILDPWYMKFDTRETAGGANEQRSQVEKFHNNHLHITIVEPKLQ